MEPEESHTSRHIPEVSRQEKKKMEPAPNRVLENVCFGFRLWKTVVVIFNFVEAHR